ncbi:neoverrucotoxin subunit alpha-like [Sebastes umbrosus]|uniref:neoverrucotoxin subunit alpha-like n=1 Tax=Sebastes umbrosus TaxID=72105 RepID=UPI00189D45A1|nr:neoverrucotoxin subunit alpha-like [Sebastes umbrosus]XP_037611997.1 neoverrucotoxin subunit alpha-like [Sebastes umbrosus]
MAVAALGRPFTLGMLYDGRKDELIPGSTLWNETTLQKNTVRSSHHSSKFEITTSDSIEDKSSLLDVDASLKASFLSGLIEVEGSAKYLNEHKKFKNQSRVTCQYKATTDFTQLLMIDIATMNTQQTDVIEKGFATHVVTGILYGANAFFVFDSEQLEASSVQDIQGSMKAVINKIPSFNIEGKVDIKLSDKEKALSEKFSCKFFGDFILESNPSTFVDAVKTYIQLPKLLGEKAENGVPVKVWLMPLKNLNPQAAELTSVISVGIVRKAQEALQDLHHLEKRCNDSLEDKVVTDFPQIHEKLSSFQTLCVDFRSVLQQTMTRKIPLIRAGEEDESKLKEVLEDRDKSPFSHEKLTEWLDNKEREITIIRSCVETMEGVKIVLNQSELDREVFAPDVEDALCFVFTSLESADPCLDEMANYLNSSNSRCTNEDPWYISSEVITKMRDKAKAFQDLPKALKNSSRFSFLVAAVANEKYKGASIYHYKNGNLVTDDFSKPDITDVENVTDRRDLIWYARELTLDPDTACPTLTLSEDNKKATHGARQSYPELPQRFDPYPQVLCREELTGRCYWELEWSAGGTENVAVGVCYRGLFRKGEDDWCRLGNNAMSWCLGRLWFSPKATLFAMYDSQSHYLPFPDFTRLGVYLDWPAGTLSYYKVSSDTLSHIHTFRNKFSEPVYPAFRIWNESYCVLLCL